MHIAVVAGETSGDLLGGGVLASLRSRVPDLKLTGVGGVAMASAGLHSLYPIDDISIMGLDGIAQKIIRALRIRKALFQRILDDHPDVFLGIDIPDFNIALEEKLRAHGIPTVHLVSPTVWAWRSYRIHRIKRAVDHMLVLFPFEEAYYREHDVPATFVGHPAADEIEEVTREDARCCLVREGIAADSPLVALLPGSRESEINQLGALFIKTAVRLSVTTPELQFILPAANATVGRKLNKVIEQQGEGANIHLIEGNARLAMAAAEVGLMASGTAALESALLARPMVVAYKVSKLSYALARLFAKVEHVSMPNHLTETPMVKEFLQGSANVSNLVAEVDRLLTDIDYRESIESSFRGLSATLRNNASDSAAKELIRVAGSCH